MRQLNENSVPGELRRVFHEDTILGIDQLRGSAPLSILYELRTPHKAFLKFEFQNRASMYSIELISCSGVIRVDNKDVLFGESVMLSYDHPHLLEIGPLRFELLTKR
ncbi:hypothetical protein ACFLZY_03320 [Patescibacteria group bacterium]